MQIGGNIKRIRMNKRLTQDEFSKETGISRSYLSDLENNRKSPTIETLEKIARKMNTSMKFLIGGSETMRGVYDLDEMQWFPADDEETPFKQELSKYEQIIRYRDKYIRPVRFEHIPIDGYTFTTEPIDPDRFYLVDENEDIYMFEEDLDDYLQVLFK